MSSAPIRVVIADNHPLILAGLTDTIRGQSELTLVGAATTGAEAVQRYGELMPDILILDITFPDMSGLQVIDAVRERDATAKAIVLTSVAAEEDIFQAMRGGVRGYILKNASTATLVEGVHQVAAGRRYLTPTVAAILANRFGSEELSQREKEVLALVANGRCNKHISRDIGISEGTIKFHLNNIFGKLGVNSRTAAINIALKRGLVRI